MTVTLFLLWVWKFAFAQLSQSTTSSSYPVRQQVFFNTVEFNGIIMFSDINLKDGICDLLCNQSISKTWEFSIFILPWVNFYPRIGHVKSRISLHSMQEKWICWNFRKSMLRRYGVQLYRVTLITLSIGTLYLLTILVLKFSTPSCV